ncbi:ComF family protein [Castellaniella sp.]|uniref:ComF family protein n=1 Tax=Castellaniella sp. TaxID=1955812 RepID=UPI0035652A39
MLHLVLTRWRHLIPADCPGCGLRVSGQGLCAACCAALRRAPAVPRCPACQHPLGPGGCPDCTAQGPACDRVVSAFDYAGVGQKLIQAYKMQGQLPLAAMLVQRLEAAVRSAGWAAGGPPDCIVPVPARAAALRQRGFSPPAEVARQLARRLGIPYRLDVLRRVREGPRQAALSRAARLAAPLGRLACGRPVAGLRVAVVDDVMTTGATLAAARAVLAAAGATQVEAWILARTLQFEPCSTSFSSNPKSPPIPVT